MHKRILSILLAVGLVLSTGVQALADPSLDEQLSTSQNQYKQSQDKVSAAQKKAHDLEANIEALDTQIQKTTGQINDLKGKISKAETNIAAAQENVNKAEENIKGEQDLYNKRMRAMYISGNEGYISVLLESKGLNDFISKVDTIKKIAEFDNKIISNLKDRKEELQQKKDALAKDKENLVALQKESQKKLDDLNKQKAEQKPLIDQANAELNSAMAFSSAQKAQIDAINKKIAAAKAAAAAAKVSINRGGAVASYSNDALVSFACSFQGIPYVWGGASPNGFDCSGLMQYTYAHFGISIPRTSQAQFASGTPVAASNLQPGDLVFFHLGSDGPGHVGMYIGNGLMVHAPHTGDVVKIIPLASHGGYCGARRYR